MKKQISILCLSAWFVFNAGILVVNAETWNILDKSMDAWNQAGETELDAAWKCSKTYLSAEQADGYVHIWKFSGADGFLTPESYPATNKANDYTIDIMAKLNPIALEDTETVFEANQITICFGGKKLKVYLKYGDAENGYLSFTPAWKHDADEKYLLDTSGWHVYRFVYYAADYTYDVYVDNLEEPVVSGVKTHYDGSNNYFRIGADKNQYCDMDIAYVRCGTGNFSLMPQVRSLSLNSDSHVAGNPHTVQVTLETDLVEDGTPVYVSVYDKAGQSWMEPRTFAIADNKASGSLDIPAGLPEGIYEIRAYADMPEGETIKSHSEPYYVVGPSPIETGLLPEVEPVGFIIDTEAYEIPSPTNEYIFPVVVDAYKHVDETGCFKDGTKPVDRYYWYHTPHDDPGGMYLYTGPTLDGPWTEQGIRMTNDWIKEQGVNTSHISSCHIIWNDVYGKYFMYFHGDNNRTNYAFSDNLWDWEYGDKAVQYDDFSFSSREASYAKVFEYEVPGYGNKYVMLLMINENDKRTIYWAHSKDGIDWKTIRKPLVRPSVACKTIPGTTTKPNYANNVSGPFLMLADGRCFVLFHSSAGNISVAEVGQNFDMEVHWGTYMNCKDVKIMDNGDGSMLAVSRVASPFFIQDDAGCWYLFIEAGHRLGANTAYAKGKTPEPTGFQPSVDGELAISFIKDGQGQTVVRNDTGQEYPYVLYGMTGVAIKEGILAVGSNTLDLPCDGMYIMRIVAGNVIRSLKILS